VFWFRFLFSSGLIRLLDFLIYSVITVSTVFFVVKILYFFFLFFVILQAVYVYLFTYLFSVIVNWVCWVRGNFSGGPGHIYSVCVTPLCGVPGRYNFIWRFMERMAGLYRFSLFSGSVAGTVRFKW
jgi:hypothetical protein